VVDSQTEKTLVGEADSQSEKTRIMSLFTDDDSIKSTDHKSRHRHSSNDFPFLSTVDDNAITSSRKNTGSNDGNGPHNFNTLGSLLSLEEKEMAKEKNRHSLGPAALITMLKGKKVDQDEDPLNITRDRVASTGSNDSTLSSGSNKIESLMIRAEDESRILAAISTAIKKQTSGIVFSVKVDISRTGSLGIGVKDLGEKSVLTVSMLKRNNGTPGSGELAGIRLGDVIFGVNFSPTRDGSKTLVNIIKRETSKGKKTIHVQCWRSHLLCSDQAQGHLFPRANDVFLQAHSLFKTKVFSEWERWNFIEILLGHMVEDLKMRAEQQIEKMTMKLSNLNIDKSKEKRKRAKQMEILDLERNILQAKGLRNALCVRIVHTKMQGEVVIYVLRVEDVETGLQWVVHRRYRDFYTLHEELADMSTFTKEINFPQKSLTMRNNHRLVESRIVLLEQYIRRVLHLLTLYATMDPSASRSLRHLQNFLGVDKYIDCVHPPLLDDQRYIELMAYRFLNDFSSPACQQCVRFITSVELDPLVTMGSLGYKPVLEHISQALSEVELFVLQQHQQQMAQALIERKSDMTQEQSRVFIRKCVRRQVEAALFLPLRRNAFRIVFSFIAEQAQAMQRALTVLQQAPPEYFMVDPGVLKAKSLPKAVKAFRDFIHAYLPADQGSLLMHAAATVMELHSECIQAKKNALSPVNSMKKIDRNDLEKAEETVAHQGYIKSVKGIANKLRPKNSDEAARASDSQNNSNDQIITEEIEAHDAKDFKKVTDDRRDSFSNGTRPNLAGKATFKDPVGEMFHSYETSAPERVLDGLLPADRYSQISFDGFNDDEGVGKDNDSLPIDLSDLPVDNDTNKGSFISNSATSADDEGVVANSQFYDGEIKHTVVSADDFLPMFTYVLVQADLPQLLLVKELMTNLVDDEETYGECGYYLATLEASTQHVCDLAAEFQNIQQKSRMSLGDKDSVRSRGFRLSTGDTNGDEERDSL
jgi:hypothetical protein